MHDPVRADAMRLLKFRPRSEKELRERLAARGHAPEAVEPLLRELKSQGLVDDARLARYWAVEKILSKPAARGQVQQELEARGLEPELAEHAVEQAAGNRPDVEIAREAASRQAERLKGLPPEVRARRLSGFLSRRGFDEEVVEQVVREAFRA